MFKYAERHTLEINIWLKKPSILILYTGGYHWMAQNSKALYSRKGFTESNIRRKSELDR
jgi:hypothetical protein